MDTALDRWQSAGAVAQGAPLAVEIIGPAGAGKSTLAGALTGCSEHIVMSYPPYYRRLADIPFYFVNTLVLLPTILHACRDTCCRPSLSDVSRMVILRGWARTLRRKKSGSREVVVLDDGPIHMLAVQWLFGPQSLRSNDQWWDKMYERWARTLDMVIWLDAPNPILVERIRARNRRHSIKSRSDLESDRFLDEYRDTFEHMVCGLRAKARDLPVVRLNTAQESRDTIHARVLDAIDRVRNGEQWR